MGERPRSAKIPEAAFASVIHAYLASPKFLSLAASTQSGYRQYLRLAELPECLGALSINVIHPADIQLWLDQLVDRPGAQERARVAIGAVERWAIPRRLLPYPITTGVEIEGSDGGHIPWTDAQVELAELHARPDIARIVTLAANTGQRGSDLYRMGPTDLEEYRGRIGINVRQKKTGAAVWIPITQQLAATMATWTLQPGPYLRKPNGAAWRNRHQMSEALTREIFRNSALEPLRSVSVPELPRPRPLVLHGLRGTAVRRLYNLGCPDTLISKMIWMSLPMVQRYLRFAGQRESAIAAVHYLDGTGTEHPAESPLKTGS